MVDESPAEEKFAAMGKLHGYLTELLETLAPQPALAQPLGPRQQWPG